MNRTAELPGVVQQLLQHIYDVPVRCDVADFLITDRFLVKALQSSRQSRDVNEKLLLSQDGEFIDMSLYLDAEVLRRLDDNDPLVDLHHLNLSDFWLVVEGISHFLYLAWNAHHDKCVTLMELELQAEVDKFVAALHLLKQQGVDDVSNELHRCLFEYARFDDRLSGDHLVRYQHASRYAGKYCKSLYSRFMQRVSKPAMLTELRRFYRLPQSAKIRHIDAAFCAVT